ncbi:MAG: VIT1/CCC1 transporter family protein [Streptococcaceae bacterium]|nr:VIT1/CCC1 transporter family protein [Streptococcaceae bacterium]
MADKKEKREMTLAERLNVLRAGVLGANDGIVSVAGVVIGVAAAGQSNSVILLAGLAALLAGAFSMAGGEYVSVSTQRDTEMAVSQDHDFDYEIEYTNPWHAAFSSFVSFTIGSILPLVAVYFTPAGLKVWITAGAVVIALFFTGYISARLGDAPTRPAVIRNIVVGILTMAVTYGIGLLLHTGGI